MAASAVVGRANAVASAISAALASGSIDDHTAADLGRSLDQAMKLYTQNGDLEHALQEIASAKDHLAKDVGATIASTGVDPHGIVLELTETCRIVDVAAATRSAQLLHDLGVGLALDDFGSQYATFELLRSLPLTVLKIDRAVVAGCDAGIGEAFTRAVVDLAGPLAARIVAEGVETTWQAERLRAAGCHEGRGHLWAPALPAAEAEQLLMRGWQGRNTAGAARVL